MAATALGLSHAILKGQVFDMCIVDEAGQITLPVALGPVLRSRYPVAASIFSVANMYDCMLLRPATVTTHSAKVQMLHPSTWDHQYVHSTLACF